MKLKGKKGDKLNPDRNLRVKIKFSKQSHPLDPHNTSVPRDLTTIYTLRNYKIRKFIDVQILMKKINIQGTTNLV